MGVEVQLAPPGSDDVLHAVDVAAQRGTSGVDRGDPGDVEVVLGDLGRRVRLSEHVGDGPGIRSARSELVAVELTPAEGFAELRDKVPGPFAEVHLGWAVGVVLALPRQGTFIDLSMGGAQIGGPARGLHEGDRVTVAARGGVSGVGRRAWLARRGHPLDRGAPPSGEGSGVVRSDGLGKVVAGLVPPGGSRHGAAGATASSRDHAALEALAADARRAASHALSPITGLSAARRELRQLREIVNADAAAPEAARELRLLAPRFRGDDPYFHLNEGHVLRAHGCLRESDETLREGLTVAEAPAVRALLWNARGQTFWDCRVNSSHPLDDHLERAEKAFRRAAVLDQSTYFPFVNLAHMASDNGDDRRCEYWVGELATARKRMDDDMKTALARYLEEAEWSRPVEGKRFWRAGPAKWIGDAVKRGMLVLFAALALTGSVTIPTDAVASSEATLEEVERERDRGRSGRHGGAGGN